PAGCGRRVQPGGGGSRDEGPGAGTSVRGCRARPGLCNPFGWRRVGVSYAFGDSDLAAYRLQQLAVVFAPSTREFLLREGLPQCRQAVDLGSGPGCTTHLLAETLGCERVVGLDCSPRFV